MFGYVNINKAELKCRELDEYKGFYCGLCKALKSRFGNASRLCVNYDLTFLSILLADLYDCEVTSTSEACPIHPLRKRTILSHKYEEYVADMTLYLSYLKCMDDWNDDKNFGRFLYACTLKGKIRKICKTYPKKCKAIKNYIKQLADKEKENCDNIDTVATIFGRLLSEVFCVENDNFTNIMMNLGFYLGKFIYVLDTYLDYEKDLKTNNYNPLHHLDNNKNLYGQVDAMLTELIAYAAANYELLPLCEYQPILSNIIYSGVWNNFKKMKFDEE